MLVFSPSERMPRKSSTESNGKPAGGKRKAAKPKITKPRKKAHVEVAYVFDAADRKTWLEQVKIITAMRAEGGVASDAPVDTMGTEAFTDSTLPPEVQRFHVLVAALLSSQTKDEMVAQAMKRLRAMEGGLTVQRVWNDLDDEAGEMVLAEILDNSTA